MKFRKAKCSSVTTMISCGNRTPLEPYLYYEPICGISQLVTNQNQKDTLPEFEKTFRKNYRKLLVKA
jgi:hypothetical protein